MPAPKTSIYKATTADAAMLAHLSVTTFRDTFSADNRKEDMDKYIDEEMNVQKLTEELADANNLFMLARHGDELAGYVKLRTCIIPDELQGRTPLEIERIYVLAQYHGQKIGAALMAHSLAYAGSHGHDVVWLGVWEHNHRAVGFYRQWGFELFGTHPFLLGNDLQTDVLMKKELTSDNFKIQPTT